MKKITVVFLIAVFLLVPSFGAQASSVDRLAELRIDTDTDIMGARLGPALYALAARADMDIIVNSKLDGTVIARLTGKTVMEALDLLARANNFNWTVEGTTIICTPADIGSQTKSFPVLHGDLEYASRQLQTFIPKNKLAINEEYGTITVNGTPAMLSQVERKLAEFQRPVAQVHIQAQMIELSKSESEKLGLGFTWGDYSGTWPPVYAITANTEGTRGKGKLLSRPSLTTFNGREAKIAMGEKVPVFSTNTVAGGTTSTAVEYKDVGMYLTVTPRINRADDAETGMVTLKLKPEVSAITKWVTSGNNKAPQISKREAETTVRVASGSTIIIGGLMKDDEIRNLIGIPYLMDLPILGNLFKTYTNSREKTEIFILVTPTILDDSGKPIKIPAQGPAANAALPDQSPVIEKTPETAPPVKEKGSV